MSILVVDDERDVRESLGDLLRVAGYDVVTASSGIEALNYLKKHKVSMMLVDMSMPGMTGEELLMRLEHDRRRPPALVITALAPWKVVGLVKHGVGYMRKPINTSLLLNMVDNFVRKDGSHGAEKTC